MFTTFKQLVCNLINNANHIRRRFISLLTIIQTTSLQLINHNKQSQQPFHFVNMFVTILTMIYLCKQFAKIHTDSKQDVNQPFTRIYSLRYDQHHKQVVYNLANNLLTTNNQSELASLIQSKLFKQLLCNL